MSITAGKPCSKYTVGCRTKEKLRAKATFRIEPRSHRLGQAIEPFGYPPHNNKKGTGCWLAARAVPRQHAQKIRTLLMPCYNNLGKKKKITIIARTHI